MLEAIHFVLHITAVVLILWINHRESVQICLSSRRNKSTWDWNEFAIGWWYYWRENWIAYWIHWMLMYLKGCSNCSFFKNASVFVNDVSVEFSIQLSHSKYRRLPGLEKKINRILIWKHFHCSRESNNSHEIYKIDFFLQKKLSYWN